MTSFFLFSNFGEGGPQVWIILRALITTSNNNCGNDNTEPGTVLFVPWNGGLTGFCGAFLKTI